MGTGLTQPNLVHPIPWLDSETAAGVAEIVRCVASMHPEVQAAILFGSVARHEERPLHDRIPSDVYLLLVLNAGALDPAARRLTHAQELALTHTVGEADYRHRLAPREIKTLFLYRDLEGWDPLFLENVARDGILLWARAPLPDVLAPVTARAPLGIAPR